MHHTCLWIVNLKMTVKQFKPVYCTRAYYGPNKMFCIYNMIDCTVRSANTNALWGNFFTFSTQLSVSVYINLCISASSDGDT